MYAIVVTGRAKEVVPSGMDRSWLMLIPISNKARASHCTIISPIIWVYNFYHPARSYTGCFAPSCLHNQYCNTSLFYQFETTNLNYGKSSFHDKFQKHGNNQNLHFDNIETNIVKIKEKFYQSIISKKVFWDISFCWYIIVKPRYSSIDM